jgi:hypothetical protein
VSQESYPVTVQVRRADGRVEEVRVGTAVRAGDGFRLTLGELSIGAVADAPGASGGGARRAAPPPSGGGDGMVFPPYGRSKGMPVVGASMGDLEYYANGCRRTLNDPAKSRWHDKERVLLAAIEAEIARQQGGGGGGDESLFDGGGGGGRRGGSGAARDDDDGPPPRGDDDIPF